MYYPEETDETGFVLGKLKKKKNWRTKQIDILSVDVLSELYCTYKIAQNPASSFQKLPSCPTNVASVILVAGCSEGFFFHSSNTRPGGVLTLYKWHISDMKTLQQPKRRPPPVANYH